MRFHIQRETVGLMMTCAILLATTSASAEIRPSFKPVELTRLSDLVVYGQLTATGQVKIVKVLKGTTTAKELAVSNFKEFVNNIEHMQPQPVLEDEVVLFLSLRRGRPEIVYNGLYRKGRIGAREGILGYWQEDNPGGYVLRSEIQYPAVAALIARVQEGVKSIGPAQAAAMQKVKDTKDYYTFGTALEALGSITRFGDEAVLREVAAMNTDDEKARRLSQIAEFLVDVADPQAAGLLEKLYEAHPGVGMLEHLGRLGNPEAAAYFERLIEKGKGPEPSYAWAGLRALYLKVERRQDAVACATVREAMYRQIDRDITVVTAFAAEVISLVPHQGSLDRLQRAFEYFSSKDKVVASHITNALDSCRERIKELKRLDTTGNEQIP